MVIKRVHKTLLKTILGLCFISTAGIILYAEQAVSTTEQMLKLPSYSRFQCSLCHTHARPTSSTGQLNLFGEDFQANGNVWNKTLAMMNSDGDKCANGFELGDMNGDGIPDEPGVGEQSNPGAQDCTITLTRQTWGIIKELFSGE